MWVNRALRVGIPKADITRQTTFNLQIMVLRGEKKRPNRTLQLPQVEGKNETEKRFKRFIECVSLREKILQDLKKNRDLLQVPGLETDDKKIIGDEIRKCQGLIDIVVLELQSIYQHFQKIKPKTDQYYINIQRTASDRSGKVQRHFQQKRTQFAGYLQKITELESKLGLNLATVKKK